jgi:hypothetical protein
MDKTSEFYSKYLWAILIGALISLALPFISFLSNEDTTQNAFNNIKSVILGSSRTYLMIYCTQFIIYLVFLGALFDGVDWMQYNWGIIAILYLSSLVVLHFMMYFTSICMTMFSTESQPLSNYSATNAKISAWPYTLFSGVITASIFGFPILFYL